MKKDLIVIEDSIYSFLLEEPRKSVASYASDNVIYIYSLSAYKKGVRIYSANKFIVGKEKPVNAVRLAVTSTSSIEELEKGLIILKQLLESESIYNIY